MSDLIDYLRSHGISVYVDWGGALTARPYPNADLRGFILENCGAVTAAAFKAVKPPLSRLQAWDKELRMRQHETACYSMIHG